MCHLVEGGQSSEYTCERFAAKNNVKVEELIGKEMSQKNSWKVYAIPLGTTSLECLRA